MAGPPCLEGRCPFVNGLDQRILALEAEDKELRNSMEANRLEAKEDVSSMRGRIDKILYLVITILVTTIGILVKH